jgi:hypothetical protein
MEKMDILCVRKLAVISTGKVGSAFCKSYNDCGVQADSKALFILRKTEAPTFLSKNMD